MSMSDELKPQSIDTPDFHVLLDAFVDWQDSKNLAALIAHIDAWRVPAGMKLVPVDSTAEMDLAGRMTLVACGNDQATERDAELCWLAMNAAVPSQEDPCGS